MNNITSNYVNTIGKKNALKKCKKLFSLIFSCVFLCFFSLFGCSYSQVLNYSNFGTNIHIQVEKGNINEKLHTEISTFLTNIENEFSTTISDSTVSRINQNGKNQAQNFSDDGIEIIRIASSLYSATKGRFNPALYPVSLEWGFGIEKILDSMAIPTSENQVLNEIRQDSEIINFNNLVINENSVEKTNDKLMVDFGGIVKGYASEKVGKMLIENGFNSGYVNMGGSSMFIMSATSLTIRHPRDTSEGIIKIDKKFLKNVSLSTSGDYENFFVDEGKRYCHIINGETLAPIETGIISATVIGNANEGANGCYLDGLTTALCCMEHNTSDYSKSEIVSFLIELMNNKSYSNSMVFVVYNDGKTKQLITNRNDADYVLLDSEYETINIYDLIK